jgi:hypothetical protein
LQACLPAYKLASIKASKSVSKLADKTASLPASKQAGQTA